MKLKIHTIIVDNMPKIAKSIEAVLLKRNSELEDIEYIPYLFKESTHFEDTKFFIFNKIKTNETIDLMICDYHLDGGNTGIELFNLLEGALIRPYKILHSFTDQTLEDHLDEKDKVYDTFSKSKTKDKIYKNIKKFEENILKIKIEGNPNISLEENKIDNIYLQAVVYAYALNEKGNEFCIGFRNSKFEIEEVKSKNIKWGAKSLNRNYENFYTVIAQNDKRFINLSVTLNLRWVSHIDTVRKVIFLILPDSLRFIISYESFKNYNIADDGYASSSKVITNSIIENLSRNIPIFFYK